MQSYDIGEVFKLHYALSIRQLIEPHRRSVYIQSACGNQDPRTFPLELWPPAA